MLVSFIYKVHSKQHACEVDQSLRLENLVQKADLLEEDRVGVLSQSCE